LRHRAGIFIFQRHATSTIEMRMAILESPDRDEQMAQVILDMGEKAMITRLLKVKAGSRVFD